jgi:GTP:adenosylcobinamide-phosphate guanylyltransferase
MDAIVTAGGIPQPGEPLYEYTQGKSKALLDVAGKPMIQWVLDAVCGATTIERVVIIGLPSESNVSCPKAVAFLPNAGGMLDNIKGGVNKVLELNPRATHALLVSSDIPAITPKMVDWVVKTSMETNDDVYYNVIARDLMETRFPGSKRSYTRLKDMEICGGDMNLIRAMTVTGNEELWNRIIAARKSVLKQAALIGYDTLILLLLRRVTLEGAVKRASRRLKVKGRAIVCPYAEVGMDVDKPHQLEIMRQDLGRK